jgi:hypothetical protein
LVENNIQLLDRKIFSHHCIRLAVAIGCDLKKTVNIKGFVSSHYRVVKGMSEKDFEILVNHIIDTWEFYGKFPIPSNFKKLLPKKIKVFKVVKDPNALTREDQAIEADKILVALKYRRKSIH